MLDSVTENFVEVVTDAEFNEFVVKLCKEDFENTEKVMDISISWVTFLCSESHCLFYSQKYKTFNIVDNSKQELPGFYAPEGAI